MKKIYSVLFLLALIPFSPTAKAQLDYKDVAHIFYSRCSSCHHENQSAQSMLTYSETYPWRNAILSDLQSGKMPPWSPDTLYTRFSHEHIINAAEKSAIISWVNSGALKGDTTLAPNPPTFSQYQLNGTPDLVLRIPTFASNASSVDAYNCFAVSTGLTQDRILRAYEIVPGNSSIVHHVIVDVDSNGTSTSDLTGGCFNPTGDFGIGGWAPGAAPTIFPGQAPLKAGIRIKAGSQLLLQIHYPVGTAGQLDSTQVRMYFYPAGETGVRPVHATTFLQNWSLYIMPNTSPTFTANYPSNGTIPSALSMFATFPHSHKVCTKITNYAYLGTDTIPLVREKWDFEWQGYYTYKNLVKVPAGYKLYSKHLFDNTTNNPNITTPVLVHAGTSTSDEMLFDSYMFFKYEVGDELIDVETLLANDPLVITSVKTNEVPSGLLTYIYPNPASNKVSIYLSKRSEYKVQLLSITGQSILQTELFYDVTSIDLKNIPAGLYIVEVIDTKTSERTTKKIIVTK